jgi:hypothetical protein
VMVGGNVVVSNGRVLNAPANLAERVRLAASDVHSASKSAIMET